MGIVYYWLPCGSIGEKNEGTSITFVWFVYGAEIGVISAVSQTQFNTNGNMSVKNRFNFLFLDEPTAVPTAILLSHGLSQKFSTRVSSQIY